VFFGEGWGNAVENSPPITADGYQGEPKQAAIFIRCERNCFPKNTRDPIGQHFFPRSYGRMMKLIIFELQNPNY
jgi:hypothetical protein